MKPKEKQELYLGKAHGEFAAYRIYRSASGVGSLDDLLGTILRILELQVSSTPEDTDRFELVYKELSTSYRRLKHEEHSLLLKLERVRSKIQEMGYLSAEASDLRRL